MNIFSFQPGAMLERRQRDDFPYHKEFPPLILVLGYAKVNNQNKYKCINLEDESVIQLAMDWTHEIYREV